jgi:protein-tyrosine phosphatase
MVDIHSHILHGLDDGASSPEISLSMVRLAAETGTTDIVATPHSDLQYSFQPELIEQKIAELSAQVGDAIRIHRGCDFHLHFDNIQDCLQNPRKYTINHKRYLLVEFSDTLIAKSTNDVFERMAALDITPVITHPERNRKLSENMGRLTEWVRLGALVQVTGQSFLGRFGKQAAAVSAELMERRLVHFIASDGHDPEYRPPVLREARAHVSKAYGEVLAEQLFETNPRATLAGEYLEFPDPEPPKKRRWFAFG